MEIRLFFDKLKKWSILSENSKLTQLIEFANVLIAVIMKLNEFEEVCGKIKENAKIKRVDFYSDILKPKS